MYLRYAKNRTVGALDYFNKHRILAYACLALVLLGLFAQPLYRFLLSSKPVAERGLPVQTIRVKTAPITLSVQTIGLLEPKKSLMLKTAIAGRVDSLKVEAGTWVAQGTLLAEIIGAPPIKAPFAGYLGDWLVKVGEHVNAGTTLIHLVDTQDLWASYKIPDYYASHLALGQSVVLKVRSTAETDQSLRGAVVFIAPMVDPKTHTIAIKATVENPKHDLWPGMFVQVDQNLHTIPDALVIPEACLIKTLEGYEVLMISGGKLEKRSVVVGARQKARAQILSGLSLDNSVVLTRNNALAEGLSAVAEDWTGDW
jgi:multidrug efflux pump subunit AcrA (membrane-fusion protein)